MRIRPLFMAVLLPVSLGAQAPSAQRPLATFAAERVAVTPVQFWRADTAGWSVGGDGAQLRAQLDSAIAREFRARGMGARWAYAGDVARSARRNPTLRADPAALGVGAWRGQPPQPGDALPSLVGDNLRTVTALGDTRYALIPVQLQGAGADAVLRLVVGGSRRAGLCGGAGDLGRAPRRSRRRPVTLPPTSHMSKPLDVTLIPGDGIGPAITDATVRVLEAAGAQFRWDRQLAGMAAVKEHGDPIPEATLASIKRTKLALKGPLETPVGKGFRSINVALRKEFDLYANLRPAKTILTGGRFDNVDVILVRENTEGLYVGVENYVKIGNDPHAVAVRFVANT